MSAGCGDDGGDDSQDAGQAGNHRLEVLDPPGPSLGLAPNETASLRVRYLDTRDQTVPDARLSFSIVGDGGGATLAAFEAYTSAEGIGEMPLTAGSEDAFFTVSVSAPNAVPVQFEVAVSAAGFINLQVIPAYQGDHPLSLFTSVRAQIHFEDRCEDHRPTGTASPDRQRFVDSFEVPLEFANLPVDVAYAVVIRALDAEGRLRAWGCADLAQDQLVPGVTAQLHVAASDAHLDVTVGFTVTSEIQLPANTAPLLTVALDPLAELGRCELGVEQALLDCLLDARFSDGTPDCVVESSAATALALAGARGQLDAQQCRTALTGEAAEGLEATLRGSLDASGLEARDRLAAVAALDPAGFTHLRLHSELELVTDSPDGQVVAWHHLLTMGFPQAFPGTGADGAGFPLALQGNHPLSVKSLPSTYLEQDPPRLILPPHSLALHPRWSVWFIVHQQLLADAGLPADPAGLLARLATHYHATVESVPVRGCEAVEAHLCQALGAPSGCLAGACAAGLDLLQQRWALRWSELVSPQGTDASFTAELALRDTDGDLTVDALGTADLPTEWLLSIQLGTQWVVPDSATFDATALPAP